jgi:RimJ/RimL family protein N-acetyltransferase
MDMVDEELIVETERLRVRRISFGDAAFMLGLLNEPSFLKFIGDRGVRSEQDARRWVENMPLASYAQHGFGHFLVERKEDGAKLGMCGLIKRPALDDVDLGFAFLPAFWSQGYARESAEAVLAWGRSRCGLRRVVAIVQPDNRSSIRLLEALGFSREGTVRLTEAGPEILLFGRAL